MEYVHAFWVGGLICAAVQILMDRTKLMPGRIMVLLVCSGAVLGFLNIYEPDFSDCRDSICKQKDTNESYRQYRSTGGYQEYSLHEFFSPCF